MHVVNATFAKGQNDPRANNGHAPVKIAEVVPWQTLCVDLIGPSKLTTKNGNKKEKNNHLGNHHNQSSHWMAQDCAHANQASRRCIKSCRAKLACSISEARPSNI